MLRETMGTNRKGGLGSAHNNRLLDQSWLARKWAKHQRKNCVLRNVPRNWNGLAVRCTPFVERARCFGIEWEADLRGVGVAKRSNPPN